MTGVILTSATPETRRRVRECFIDPLTEEGVERIAGSTVVDHDAVVKELCGRLSYLRPAELHRLRELIRPYIKVKRGAARWPAVSLILSVAEWSIRRPPPSCSEMVRAIMGCSAGQRAVADGYGAAAIFYMRKIGAPPHTKFAWDQVRADHVRRMGSITHLRGKRAAGVVLTSGEERELDLFEAYDALATRLAAEGAANGAETGNTSGVENDGR